MRPDTREDRVVLSHRGRRFSCTLTTYRRGFQDDDGRWFGRWAWRVVDADPTAKIPLDGDDGFCRSRWGAARKAKAWVRRFAAR